MFLKVDRREPEARRGRIIFRKSKQGGIMPQGYGILHDMQRFSLSVTPRGVHARSFATSLNPRGRLQGLLFHENLPLRLRFSPSLPAIQAREFGKADSDSELWERARDQQLVIGSKS